jgi:hypothetical protein
VVQKDMCPNQHHATRDGGAAGATLHSDCLALGLRIWVHGCQHWQLLSSSVTGGTYYLGTENRAKQRLTPAAVYCQAEAKSKLTLLQVGTRFR